MSAKSPLKTLLLATSAAAFLPAAMASAQTQRPPEEDVVTLDVVVVTVRKQEEIAADVPISLTAFDSVLLEERLIDNISEISDFTPGFQQQQAFGRDGDRPVIRGASNILFAEGKVGYFLDGIPITGDVSALNFSNLERIEVIKGPQSAVFGRGTLSGAVNFVTKAPGDSHEFFVEGTVGNYDRLDGVASWSGPITDWLSGYANLSFDSFGGDYDNNVTGGKLNERETLSASGFLYFNPTSDLSATLRVLYQDVDDGHFAIELQGSEQNNVFANSRGYFDGEVSTPSDSAFGLNTDTMARPGLERETTQVLWDVNYDVLGSGYEFSYIGGITTQDEVTGVDQSYDDTQPLLLDEPAFPFGPSNCVFLTGIGVFSNTACGKTAFEGTSATRRDLTSHELRLRTPDQFTIRGSIGLFYSDETRKGLPEFLEATEFGLDSISDKVEVENTAIFGAIEADVTDRLTVSAELRYAEDEITNTIQEYTASQYFSEEFLNTLGNPNPDQVVRSVSDGQLASLGLTFDDVRVRSETFTATLPRLTARYALNSDMNVYAQYAEGNSPGGFNVVTAPDPTIEEEELASFELGFKGRLWDRVDTSIALFHNVYENQALTGTFVDDEGRVDSFVQNIGESETTGIEIEASSQIFEGFTLAGTLSYQDSEITDGFQDDQAILTRGIDCLADEDDDSDPPVGGVVGGVYNPDIPTCGADGSASIVGKKAPLVSDVMATLSARYEAPTGIANLNWFAGGDVIYRSSFYTQVHNLAETGDATRVNLQAGIERGAFRLTAWGENVLDDDTPDGIIRYVDFDAPELESGLTQRAFGVTPPAKPSYGVTGSVRF